MYLPHTLVLLTSTFSLLMGTTLYAAQNIDNTNDKAIRNVHWHKVEHINVQQLLNKSMPVDNASIFFLRRLDNDPVQTSANIAINNRFHVSLQPGNYSQIYSCAGINKISGDITGNKTNDLSKNNATYEFKPNTTYFYDVNVDANGMISITPISQDSALIALQHMPYQAHQISRVVPNCSPAPIAMQKPLVEPVAPPPPAQESIELKVLFDNDQAIVKPKYYNEIKKVADFMTRHPNVTGTIEGHTDSNASEQYNVGLSQRRVNEVKKLLVEKFNIDSTRLNAIGYGESRPIASNANPEGREQNRRVIAVIQTN